jgi:hypothetical protein
MKCESVCGHGADVAPLALLPPFLAAQFKGLLLRRLPPGHGGINWPDADSVGPFYITATVTTLRTRPIT